MVVVVTGGAVVVVVGADAGAGGTVELVVRLPSDAVVEPLLGVRSTTVAPEFWFDVIPDEPEFAWVGCVVVEVAGAAAPELPPPGAVPPDEEDPPVDGLVKVGMVVGPLAPCTLRVGGLAAPVANKVATNRAAAATLTVAIMRLRISATRGSVSTVAVPTPPSAPGSRGRPKVSEVKTSSRLALSGDSAQ